LREGRIFFDFYFCFAVNRPNGREKKRKHTNSEQNGRETKRNERKARYEGVYVSTRQPTKTKKN